MSKSPETGFDLDLHFLPSWAQQPADVNRYAKFDSKDIPQTPRRGKRPRQTDRQQQQGGFRRKEGKGGNRPPRRREGREEAKPLPEVGVQFVPEEKGVESLVKQIKLTGRAYPIFEIASLILKKPDRFYVQFHTLKGQDGKNPQDLFVCNLDDAVFLSEQEAINYVFNKHFDTFYQTEKIPVEPPKGKYTFVAQCGMSGVILGPPNCHDYQSKLRKLHSQRFSRMAFETFKSRVKIVKDEEIVQKWLEDQSFKNEYICLNVAEQTKLFSMDEVEQHFRETHLPNIIEQVDSYSVRTLEGRQRLPSPLQTLSRRALEDQKRFPLKVVTQLSQQFASHGLQFFKVKKAYTHVVVARPNYLDLETTPVSQGVRDIVNFINKTENCTRKTLIESLAPSPTAEAPASQEAETPSTQEPATKSPETQETKQDSVEKPSATEGTDKPTPEQTKIISNLHWLIHQGHVIEFANGLMETAKKPAPKPEKATKKKQPSDTKKSDSQKKPKAKKGKSDRPRLSGATNLSKVAFLMGRAKSRPAMFFRKAATRAAGQRRLQFKR
jgi:hypothetical protein